MYVRRKAGGGLGATDEEFFGARDNLIGFINRTNARIEGLASTPPVEAIRAKMRDAARWFQAALNRFYMGKTGEAMESFGVSYRLVHEASTLINALRPQDRIAAGAQAKAQQGASFSYQVEQTMAAPFVRSVTEPIATAVESVSPAAAAAVRSSGWLLPAAAGLTLFLLLRR